MLHTFRNTYMSFVLALLVYLLLAVAADSTSTSGCYRPTAAKPSPRICDSEGKNCRVPVVVDADHKPGMRLCFHVADATYEVFPVKATAQRIPNAVKVCRPMIPSTTVTGIDDICFYDITIPTQSALRNSSVKQQGTYTICSKDDLQICYAGSVFGEQDCLYGLYTWMANCSTTDCPDDLKVASYYCPNVTPYNVAPLEHAPFEYAFELEKTNDHSAMPEKVSSILPISAVGDQPNPYTGWTLITNNTYPQSPQFFVRPLPVSDGDCSDYCAMIWSKGNFFHTTSTCYTVSSDICAPTRQVTWKEFDRSRNNGSLILPYKADGGSTLDKRAAYSTPNIVSPFTYTINIDLDTPHADPQITTLCDAGTAAVLDTGVKKQACPDAELFYVRRVCDQVAIGLYDCVLKYSHHDERAMYWSVENTGNKSQCIVHVIDDNSVQEVIAPVTPMSEPERGTVSTKKL